MDIWNSLLQGFGIALTPGNLLFTLVGVVIGQVIGALPGIGPSAGMALLLPITYGMPPVTALMMLAGIMYGGMYGGTLTSVLINVPGEAASVMTAVDGHQLARVFPARHARHHGDREPRHRLGRQGAPGRRLRPRRRARRHRPDHRHQ